MVNHYPENNKRYLILYIVAILLFVAGYLQVFKDRGKDYALIYFSVITAIWGISVQYRFYNPNHKFKNYNFKITVPHKVKCLFNEKRCEEGDLNSWSALHFVIYLIAGFLFPNRFIFFLIISLLCELFELKIVDCNAKWILDPTTNMLGYVIGSLLVDLYINKN